MSAWVRDESPLSPGTSDDERRRGIFGPLREEGTDHTSQLTAAGADWLASAGPYPRSTLSLWATRPTAPGVVPCGSAFDVVNAPAVFGRRMLDRLWADGPGSGPVSAYRGRMLLFAAPGTAQRLPALLAWEEWGRAGIPVADQRRSCGEGGRDGVGTGEAAIPPLLFHGPGDAVTVPPLTPGTAPGPRWVVAPDTRHPWLPGPDVLLWACVRAARAALRTSGPAGHPSASRPQGVPPRKAPHGTRGAAGGTGAAVGTAAPGNAAGARLPR
ncbi:hypothetical protein [Streptomyces sp. NPDC088725]|uniref:hypothetical protein n=1 Tax=Streptomyces sp. NPDC088725 TaxID=3365873 RepID=UPI003820CC91